MNRKVVVGIAVLALSLGFVFGASFYLYTNEVVWEDRYSELELSSQQEIEHLTERIKTLGTRLSKEKLDKDIHFPRVVIKPDGNQTKVSMTIGMYFNESYDAVEYAIKYVEQGGTIVIWDDVVVIADEMIPEGKWFKVDPKENYGGYIYW